jgi:hypothetical protein
MKWYTYLDAVGSVIAYACGECVADGRIEPEPPDEVQPVDPAHVGDIEECFCCGRLPEQAD